MARVLIDNGSKSQLKQSWDGDGPGGTAKFKKNLMTVLRFDLEISKINGKSEPIVGFSPFM